MSIRIVKNDWDYKDMEVSASCGECDVELAVMPPKSVQKKVNADPDNGNDILIDWQEDRYYYCPKCQKDHGHRAIEKGA